MRIENSGVVDEELGWRLDYMPPPYLTEPTATADTVRSLALINQMLDEQINARVLYHFFVKHPEDLEKAPNLDTFFYPDYGLRQGSKSIGRNDSIALILQKIRAHVVGQQDSNTLCSLVLYGPQGTGKTTIAEALASSCQVPLVEVTPSDLLVGGAEGVERRARTVFEALSLLTRVVILFDEFDPVLWKRKPSGDRPSSIFGFLTASMLPKLKTLYKTAGKRSVAYMLITNLIDSLDEPTVRKGRFDDKLGIYPPDVLSRAGRFLSEADALLSENDPLKDLPNDEISKNRLKEIVGELSSGAGMEGLNRKGYFRRPDNKELPKDSTPLHYYLWGGEKPEQLKPDAQLQGVNGEGSEALREYQEWAWVAIWDKRFMKTPVRFYPQILRRWRQIGFQALEKPPAKLPKPRLRWQLILLTKKVIRVLFS